MAKQATAAAIESTSNPSVAPEGTDMNAANAFTFDISVSVPVPTDLPKRAPRASELPFKGKFSEMLPKALAGQQPHLFIPDDYWTTIRKVPADKLTPSFVKDKVAGQFRAWQYVHKDGKNTKVFVKGHEGVILTTVYRPAGSEGFPNGGLSVWLLKAEG